MRKIVSKQEADKKKRRNQFIVGGVLIMVMFLSVMGYAFQNSIISGNTQTSSNSTQTITYNGVQFSNQNGFWVLQTENNRFVFTYNPSEIPASNLANLTKTMSDFSGKPLYVYSNDTNSESELTFNMKSIASNVYTEKMSNMSLGPNCAYNSIIIENGTEGVKENQNCIFISGQGEGLIKLIDNVLFNLMGIRNG